RCRNCCANLAAADGGCPRPQTAHGLLARRRNEAANWSAWSCPRRCDPPRRQSPRVRSRTKHFPARGGHPCTRSPRDGILPGEWFVRRPSSVVRCQLSAVRAPWVANSGLLGASTTDHRRRTTDNGGSAIVSGVSSSLKMRSELAMAAWRRLYLSLKS